ncbi:MAG: hypothetical protein BGO14_00730 [Chlamydiales bacterium 38-26]|nr:NUDIX domain-containing protein [Chlamydiales bacterium]OJV07247.1 MAG: hypothetical protein BGO14_00730 [Chlamydiales bacterium 38-26]
MIESITRVGVYGLIQEGEKLLLVQQPSGPFKGRWDFPGGGIELGETVEQTLRRELIEEIHAAFDTMKFLDNLTCTTPISSSSGEQDLVFFQIGLIYKVQGLQFLELSSTTLLSHAWVKIEQLHVHNTSPLLWKLITYHLS